MSFRTTCPNCSSVFRLGENQLGAAQGWVQCSVCGSAFDARLSLLLEDGSPLPTPVPETLPPAEPAPAEATLPPEAALPGGEEVPASLPPETSLAEAHETPSGPTVDAPRGIAQREASLDLDSIILIDPDIPVPEDPGPLPQMYPAPTAYPARPSAPAPAPHAVPPAAPAARVEYANSAPAVKRAAPAKDRTPRARRARAWLWSTASVLLLLALLAQIAYFLRDTLAGQLPKTRPALEQACAVLGCTLSLPKQLAQLQIVGSDLQTETSGRLRLTLTLGNRSGQAQAWPMLVLTLTDQRNRPLARRSFAPSEYLEDARRIDDGIPPGSEQALSLPLTVRGPAPMGFDLQITY